MAYNFYLKPLDEKTTFTFKKTYDDLNFSVVIADKTFAIKKGATRPILVCWIKQQGEQYGDLLAAQIPDGHRIYVSCYDNSGGLILKSEMTQTDTNLGEWTYTFSPIDFSFTGVFDSHILIVNSDNESSLVKFKINVF